MDLGDSSAANRPALALDLVTPTIRNGLVNAHLPLDAGARRAVLPELVASATEITDTTVLCGDLNVAAADKHPREPCRRWVRGFGTRSRSDRPFGGTSSPTGLHPLPSGATDSHRLDRGRRSPWLATGRRWPLRLRPPWGSPCRSKSISARQCDRRTRFRKPLLNCS